MNVVVLAGGTGGAKLAAGMQELAGDELTVIANTADDLEAFGVHISPDPDLVTYWLTDQIDAERGWGIRGDSFSVFERLAQLGEPDWFGLGNLDLATCLRRRRLLDDGLRQTEAQEQISRALGARARVLAMCDQPVRTIVHIPEGRLSLQEFLVRDHAAPEIEAIELDGIEAAALGDEVAAALASADAIVLGPSNPVISIGPILAVAGIREAIERASAPVVAVSPFVGGRALKGPTEKCMRAIDREPSASGVAKLYGNLIDGLVADESDPEPAQAEVPVLSISTLMAGPQERLELARRTLEFAGSLS